MHRLHTSARTTCARHSCRTFQHHRPKLITAPSSRYYAMAANTKTTVSAPTSGPSPESAASLAHHAKSGFQNPWPSFSPVSWAMIRHLMWYALTKRRELSCLTRSQEQTHCERLVCPERPNGTREKALLSSLARHAHPPGHMARPRMLLCGVPKRSTCTLRPRIYRPVFAILMARPTAIYRHAMHSERHSIR